MQRATDPLALVVETPAEVAVFDAVGPRMVIGRSPECDVSIPSLMLARRHLRFLQLAEGWAVEDAGSTSGLYVMGRKVQGQQRLGVEEKVVLGAGVSMWLERVPRLEDEERSLLARLSTTAHGALVYADWLEARGELHRASDVRVRLELEAATPGTARHASLDLQRTALSRIVRPWHRALVARLAIERCARAGCPGAWEALALTDEGRTRRCGECWRAVRYCDTVSEASARVRRGEAVVIDPARVRRPGDLGE